jgi:signal transduction histidine kinase
MSIEKVQEYVKKIGDSNSRMIDLVSDLISTSKADSGNLVKEMKGYSIRDLIQQAIDEQERTISGKNITIKGMSQIPKDLKIDADTTQIVQVLGNLFENAANFSPKGSKIEIGVEQGLDLVKIYVKDHGMGIPLDQQKDVFKKFFRADNVAKIVPGSGLGLYLAKRMVENHGGKIWFESKEKLGTTFFVELPIKQNNG